MFRITHIHDILKHNKRSAFCLLLVAYPYLTYAAITPKQVVEIVSRNLIVEILYKKDPIGTWRELCLDIKSKVGNVIQLTPYRGSCKCHLKRW